MPYHMSWLHPKLVNKYSKQQLPQHMYLINTLTYSKLDVV